VLRVDISMSKTKTYTVGQAQISVTNSAKKIERPFFDHVKSTCNFVAQSRLSVTKSTSVHTLQIHRSIGTIVAQRTERERAEHLVSRGITPCTIGSGTGCRHASFVLQLPLLTGELPPGSMMD